MPPAPKFSTQPVPKSGWAMSWLSWPSIPILPGQSWILTACPGKITRSPGTLNCPEFQTLSRFEYNVMSHVDKVYSYRPNTYTKIVVIWCVLSSSKCSKIHCWTHWGSLWCSPRPPSWLGRGYPLPYPSPRRLQWLDLGASNSVPIFCHRFMVALVLVQVLWVGWWQGHAGWL